MKEFYSILEKKHWQVCCIMYFDWFWQVFINTCPKVSFYFHLKSNQIKANYFLFEQNTWLLSFSSHFSFFVLVDKSYEKRKYYIIVCLFFITFHFRLACLALQTENIVQKIPQLIFVFGNFVNQNKKRKMGWKAHKYSKVHSVIHLTLNYTQSRSTLEVY